ncbi:MAG: hypothetical protein M3R02_05460 [Chloroflexota bacterium]|nr:hypothetical protein [Chloroflexota bacterium]
MTALGRRLGVLEAGARARRAAGPNRTPWDFSRLSDQELEDLGDLVVKVHARPDLGPAALTEDERARVEDLGRILTLDRADAA